MKIGIVQLRSTEDIWENLFVVDSFVQEAESCGCEFICFPENVLFRGRASARDPEGLLELDENGQIKETSSWCKTLNELRSQWKIPVSLGSVLEASSDKSRPFNSHWVLFPDRKIISYQKIHLFSFRGTDAVYREEDYVTPGRTPVSFRFHSFWMGLTICYDLRFPELFRILSLHQNVNLFLVPSAFTYETGKAHWHTLLRARAIENLSYVMAPAQWGTHQNDEQKTLRCYGHSLAYSPWGELLVEAQEAGDALLTVDIDESELTKYRAQLSALDSAIFKC